MSPEQHIIQNAYVVDDLDAAIARWHAVCGIGPFFVRRHLQLAEVRYRGRAARLDFSAAYVQAGPVMVELVQQHDAEPSAFRDMFGPGQQGFHHVAVVPTDYQALLAHYEAQGCAVAMELRTSSGRGAAYVDTRNLVGHMTEVYLPTEGLAAVYQEVAMAAARWDGRQLVIEVDAGR
jgi:hypothetical protein